MWIIILTIFIFLILLWYYYYYNNYYEIKCTNKCFDSCKSKCSLKKNNIYISRNDYDNDLPQMVEVNSLISTSQPQQQPQLKCMQ